MSPNLGEAANAAAKGAAKGTANAAAKGEAKEAVKSAGQKKVEERARKKANKDAWKAKQQGMDPSDYSKLKKDMEADFKQESLNEAAQKNGWSVDDEKEWRRSLKEEQDQNQRKAAKLQKEQGKQATATRDNQNNPQPQQDTASEIDKESQEKLKEQEEERAQEEADKKENIAKVKEDTAEKIAELKEEEATEIEQEKAGRKIPFPASLFVGFFVFAGLTALDSSFALAPGVGDFLGFALLLALWSIPCILIFSVKPMKYILMYLIFDMIFGLIFGTIADVIIPFAGDAVVDLIPEVLIAIGMIAMPKSLLAKMYPPNAIKNTYNSPESIARRIARIKDKFKRKIQAVRDGTKDKIKGILKGHFRGPGSEDIHKMVFFVLLVVTMVLGPFGTGYISLERSLQAGIFTAIYLLILLLFERIGLMSFKNFIGIVMLIFFNAILNPLLSSDLVSGFLGANTEALFKGILLVFMIVATLHFGGIMSGKVVGIIAIFTLLVVATPHMIGAVSNTEKIQAQQDTLQTQAQIAVEKADLVDRIMAWVNDSMRSGKGEDIKTTTQENTAKYIGVKISDVRSLKPNYYQGETVTMLIDFEGKVFQPTTVRTTCTADKYVGTVEPETFDMQNPVMGSDELLATLYPRVECKFENLPVGAYKINIKSYYRHNSSVRFPLRIMSYAQSKVFYDNFVDTGKYTSVKNYIGGEPNILASSGPVVIEVANGKTAEREWTYIDPLIVDPAKLPENPITHLTFQLKQAPDDTTGKIQSIQGLSISLPEGLEISCNGINKDTILPYTAVDGRWISTVKPDNFDIALKELIDCKLYVQQDYVDTFVPPTSWSSESMIMNVMYDYEEDYIYGNALQVI